MEKNTRYVGLDVHAETIAAAVGEGHGKVRSLGQFPNRPEAVRKFIEKLGEPQNLRVCYEAGPTGYALYWQLTKIGVACEVVAPSLVPRKPGEKVKTDRRDAEKLALCYQSGTLTSVWVPDAAHEALRDLVRARGAAKKDESRAKHRLVKLLLRHGLRHPANCRAWTHPWWRWVQELEFKFEPQRITLGDCIAEVLHQHERLARLDLAIDKAIETTPRETKAVVEALCHSPGSWGHVSPGPWGQVTGIEDRGSNATDRRPRRARRSRSGRRSGGHRRLGGAFRRGVAGGFFTGAEGGGPRASMLGLSRDR